MMSYKVVFCNSRLYLIEQIFFFWICYDNWERILTVIWISNYGSKYIAKSAPCKIHHILEITEISKVTVRYHWISVTTSTISHITSNYHMRPPA